MTAIHAELSFSLGIFFFHYKTESQIKFAQLILAWEVYLGPSTWALQVRLISSHLFVWKTPFLSLLLPLPLSCLSSGTSGLARYFTPGLANTLVLWEREFRPWAQPRLQTWEGLSEKAFLLQVPGHWGQGPRWLSSSHWDRPLISQLWLLGTPG